MRISTRATPILVSALFTLLMLGGINAGTLGAKDKKPSIGPDDPTVRLFALLDSKFDGKLKDFYVLADIFNDPNIPGKPQQHILSIEYDKSRVFGKLQIHVRTVGQPDPEQLKACLLYTSDAADE